MPELPEVQTTVNGLNEVLRSKKFTSVWSDYNSSFHKGKKNIKDKKYFDLFKKQILNSPVLKAERKGKNILIHLKNGKTILIHMKMTGHLLYGNYKQNKKEWAAKDKGPLQDPFNRHIRLVFTLSNGRHLALSDMRKFAKVTLLEHESIGGIAPDPFQLTEKEFVESLRNKKSGRIKNVLMDQTLISGIGNIYSDETLFETGVHPESNVSTIPDKKLKEIYKAAKKILKRGINFGGDSTSDYRNIKGERGKFQHKHKAYRRTGEKCLKKGCRGKIERKVVGGRSSHFCKSHQKMYNSL